MSVRDEVSSFPNVDEAVGWIIDMLEEAMTASSGEDKEWAKNALEYLREPVSVSSLEEAKASVSLCGDGYASPWGDIWDALDEAVMRLKDLAVEQFSDQ